ncbi:MAG: hypothetical protein ACI4JY_09350 [Oscillospiraceae bacterium]
MNKQKAVRFPERLRLSKKNHLLRQRHGRQAQSLAVVPFPRIWGLFASLFLDFFDKLSRSVDNLPNGFLMLILRL